MKTFLFIALMGLSVVLSSCSKGYVKKDGKVYYDYWNEAVGHACVELEEADYGTFEVLKGSFARDAHQAWYCGDIIEGADGATFRVLDSWYAVDDKGVFFCGDAMEQADPKSFRPITYYYAEDAKDYFWNGHPLHVADKGSFKLMGDPDDFQTEWGVDKQYVYCLMAANDSNRARVADYETFHVIKNEYASLTNYAADKYQVYFVSMVVEGADPETFREVDYLVGQDKNRVYYSGEPTAVTDFNSLTRDGNNYIDSLYVYARDFTIVEGADPKSFRALTSPWAADEKHVFWNDGIVNGADPETFNANVVYSSLEEDEPSDSWDYGRDKDHVFYHDSIIAGADPKTFTVLDAPDAESWTIFDKNRYYEGEETEFIRQYKEKHF